MKLGLASALGAWSPKEPDICSFIVHSIVNFL